MKIKFLASVFLLTILLLGSQSDTFAQFRADQPSSFYRTGNIIKETRPAGDERVLGLFDFRMNHSYEMSVGSMGGNTFNQNFYTNTMHFLFNEKFYGRLDLGVAHSPFGNSLMGNNQSAQFLVRNAELNYRLNENTHFRVSFQQNPGYGYGYGYGYNTFGQRFNRGYHNPFYHGW